MNRTAFARLCVVGISLMSGGCAAVDNINGRVGNLNRDVDSLRNEALLLNIVRAGHGHPLNFVTVSTVGGTRSMTGNFGLPSITFGPDKTVAQKQYTFGNNSHTQATGGSFNLSPLDSKEFYSGLLTPLTFNSAQFFVRQGFPREVVFYLFIEELKVTTSNRTRYVQNDPGDPSFPEFVHFMQLAVTHGLSLEQMEGTQQARLCLDPALALRDLGRLRPICGDHTRTTALSNFRVENVGLVDLEMTIRSTYQIFHYLGQVTRKDNNQKVILTSNAALTGNQPGEVRLFPISYSEKSKTCLTETTYAGEFYCVPLANNMSGGRVLDLLSMLLALSSSVRDLPVVQNIQITQ